MAGIISDILKKQDEFIKSFQPRDIKFRVSQLKKLKQAVKDNEQLIYDALWADLKKSVHESYTSELGLFYNEISLHIKKLRKWAQIKKVYTPLSCFPSTSAIQHIPFGRVLIIGAFNFPFQLNMVPLVGAISAGNTVVLKPSEHSHHTSAAMAKIINNTFNKEYIRVVEGDIETNKELLKQRWDMIFFTGSPRVGKIVMEAASKFLTPVVLELGGKNPVIVDKECNISVSAKRIAWGKFLNAGQSCVAPDYLLIHEDIRDRFLAEFKKHLEKFYTINPERSNDLSRIRSKTAFARLKKLMESGTIYFGGVVNEEDDYISPTILTDVNPDSPVMQDEIFGPILPVLTFSEFDEAIDFINSREKPLSAYLYSSNRKNKNRFLQQTSSGDAAINDSVTYFVNHKLPFGGIGYSGMGGGYHGKHTFEVFSHKRSVYKTTTKIDLPLRYPPYVSWVLKIIKFLLK